MSVPEVGAEVRGTVELACGGCPESVILILQGASPDEKPGIIDGFERLRRTGVVRDLSVFPVFGPDGVERGESYWRDVIATAHAQHATLVVFHYYHSPALPDPRPAIDKLRALSTHPSIVMTLGDAFLHGYFGRPRVPRSFLQGAEMADLVTLTSMGALADHVVKHTNAPIMLLPHGVCQVRFGAPSGCSSLHRSEVDVAFVGSQNRSRNPLRGYFWAARRRERLITQLAKRHGSRFALFGRGWDHLPCSRGPIEFQHQVEAVRCARVVFGGLPFSWSRYYASDRPFIQATSGIPLIDVAAPGVDALLRDGEHWVLAREDQVIEKVDEMLSRSNEELSAMGQKASEYVYEKHTLAHRVAALVENARRQRAMKTGDTRVAPHLPFFHDAVDLEREAPEATRNWYSR